MRNFVFFCIILINLTRSLFAQPVFTDMSSLYLGENRTLSTLTIGMVDINGDTYDDIITLDEGKKLIGWLSNGDNIQMDYLQLKTPVAQTAEWSFTSGDLDNDGVLEIITAGAYNNIKVFKYNKEDHKFELSQSFVSNSYGQGSNIIDINHDGWNDYFLCHDRGESRVFLNDQTGKLYEERGLIDFSTDPVSDMSGNYGSEWVDIDDDGIAELYMAKCSVYADEFTDPRRINQLMKMQEDGTYADIAEQLNIAYGDQTWTSTFADLDNDGDLDLVVANHYTPHIFAENVGGTFEVREVTPEPIVSFAFEVMAADFDNDGLEDILITGDRDYLFYNLGGFNFELRETVFDYYDTHTAGLGDVNKDGFIDAYVGYGEPIIELGNRFDALWINEGNDNHFATFKLRGIENNITGTGAKIKIYGPWGIQQRNIKSGEGYGTVHSQTAHFGLAGETTIDSVIVTWPGGNQDKYYNVPADEHYAVTEGGCISSPLEVYQTVSGFCPGEAIGFGVNEELDEISWNTGDTSWNINVNTASTVSVTAKSDMDCYLYSDLYQVKSKALNAYSTGLGDSITICEGEIIEINDEQITSALWADGSSGTLYKPTASGELTVKIIDECSIEHEDELHVTLVSSEFTLQGDTIYKGDSAVLVSSNKNTYWFEDFNEMTPIYIGDVFVTPVLESSRVYFAESRTKINKKDYSGGLIRVPADEAYASDHLNVGMRFDVDKECDLRSVKVYTDTPGERGIIITNEGGDTVYYQIFDMVEGENILELEFRLTTGNNYTMITDEQVNLDNRQVRGPRLERTSENVFYPYSIENILSIHGTTRQSGYYFFYDWQISTVGEECISDRKSINVEVNISDNTSDLDSPEQDLYIFPNPVMDFITIESNKIIEKIEVYSYNGHLISINNIKSPKGIIDMSNYDSGIYFLKFFLEKQNYFKKIIKN